MHVQPPEKFKHTCKALWKPVGPRVHSVLWVFLILLELVLLGESVALHFMLFKNFEVTLEEILQRDYDLITKVCWLASDSTRFVGQATQEKLYFNKIKY